MVLGRARGFDAGSRFNGSVTLKNGLHVFRPRFQGKYENLTITTHIGYVVEEKLGQRTNHMIILAPTF